jgi:hypothetical protein
MYLFLINSLPKCEYYHIIRTILFNFAKKLKLTQYLTAQFMPFVRIIITKKDLVTKKYGGGEGPYNLLILLLFHPELNPGTSARKAMPVKGLKTRCVQF